MKKINYLFLILFLGSIVVQAQTGKISGRVTDLETGDPLIGANVLVEGTSLGAATNVDGEYIILNVPPSTYTLEAKYIGYKTVTQSNVKISSNVTTTIDFELPSETYELGTVEIVAQKPLIEKNVTSSVSIVRAEDIENLPVRGVNAVVSTQAGVVNQGGNLHIRGGRSDAVAFYVDGVLVNNPVFGGATSLGIQNAIEEIQVHAGGYPAEYGGANAGIVSTTTKIGGERYAVSLEAITDNFAGGVGEKFLGTYSYGYSEYVLTASGPVLPSFKTLRFFIAGNNIFNRTPIGWYSEVNYPGLYDAAQVRRDTIDLFYPGGQRLNAHNNVYNVQGNLSWDLNPINIRLNGSYRTNEGRAGATLNDIFRVNRVGVNEGQTITGSLKFTHVLSNNAFYDVIGNYFNDYNVTMDPIFKHNISIYGDKEKNAEVGSIIRSDGVYEPTINVYGLTLDRYERPWNAYTKNRYESYGGKANLLYQIGQHHEMKLGGEVTYYTIRRYALPSAVGIASNRRSNPDGNPADIYARLDAYGYDVFGNTIDEGIDGPKHPLFGAFYLQDKIEYSDLVINAGLRLDYIDTDSKSFENPNKIVFDENDEIDANSLVDLDPFIQVSPRLGFSFPVTDRTVFHAQYGKFIQQSRLRDIYQGYNVIADNIKGGFAIQNPVGFGLRPERSTQYELGFRQQLGENFAFDITGFYKDIKDQIQIRSIFAAPGANHRQYYAFVNGDFSTVKGVEFKLDLRRIERIAATVDYTFSDAQGTGSNPSSSFRQIWQSPTATPFFPQQIAPLDFNQTHRGFLNIDFRFADNDGPSVFGSQILENFGLNMLFSFTSGFNFTKYNLQSFGNTRTPTEALNASTTPWTFQLDFRFDKTVSFGPLNTNIYLWVVNVLNTQNVVDVYRTSGDAFDDNYLSSPAGVAAVQGYEQYGDEVVQTYKNLYQDINYFNNPGFFGPPRQIRLGIKLNY
jgi:outer membrane receptor protein involved in Fe transport